MMRQKLDIFDKYTKNGRIFIPEGLKLCVHLGEVHFFKEKNTNKYRKFTLNNVIGKYEHMSKDGSIEISVVDAVLEYTTNPNDTNLENKIMNIIEESKTLYQRDLVEERINKLQTEISSIIEEKEILINEILKKFNFAHSDKHITSNRDTKKNLNGIPYIWSNSYTVVLNQLNPNYVNEVIAKYSNYEPEKLNKEKEKNFIFVICSTIKILSEYINYLQESIKNITINNFLICNIFGTFMCDTINNYAYWVQGKLHVKTDDIINIREYDGMKDTFIKGNEIVFSKNKKSNLWNFYYD